MNSFDHVNNILTVKNVKKPFKGPPHSWEKICIQAYSSKLLNDMSLT